MKLSIYLTVKGISYKEFGEQVGVSRVYLSQIANGLAPSWRLARDIEVATNKHVTINELISGEYHPLAICEKCRCAHELSSHQEATA